VLLVSIIPIWSLGLPCSKIDVAVYSLLSQNPFLVQTVIQKMAPNKPSMATIRSSRSPKFKSEVLKNEREEQKECTLSGEPVLVLTLQQCDKMSFFS
jgi:hypothetical protein